MDVVIEQATTVTSETFSHRELRYRQLRDNDTPTNYSREINKHFFNSLC